LTLAAGVEPLDDPALLRHATSPLTPDERAALADFLAGRSRFVDHAVLGRDTPIGRTESA